jgi:hypothetical protein
MLSELTASVIATVPSVVAAVELFIRLPIGTEICKLRSTMSKSIKVVSSSRISDHWKEKATQRYSLSIMTSSWLLFLYVVALFVVFCVIYALAGLFLFESVQQAISQLMQIKIQFVVIGIGVLYAFLRKSLFNG